MEKKVTSGIMLTLLLVGISTLAFNVLLVGAESTEPPATEWSKTYGGTSLDWPYALVQTVDGGYALVGITESFGAGNRDAWLVKTDASGNVQWNKTYGGTSDDPLVALVQTGDGGYALAGQTRSFTAGGDDFWLVKTDAVGNAEWNRTYGGTSTEAAYALVQTVDGGYALAGYTTSYGAGGSDVWLVKTDSTGNAQWNRTYGGTSLDSATALVQAVDGGYALAGITDSFGAGGLDSWLVKTDANGMMQWNNTYGGTGSEGASALVQTVDGGYALTSSTESFGAGSLDFWLVKTDTVGNAQWNRTYGGTSDDYGAYALVQTSDSGYALAGPTASYGAGSYDFWLIKLAPEMKPTLIITTTNKGSGKTETITLELVDENHDGFISIDIENRILAAIRRTYGTTTFDFPGEYTATQGAWTVTLSCQNDCNITLT